MDTPATTSRRDLIRRGTMGAAAAGAAWVAPVVLSGVAAATGSTCGLAANLDWCTMSFPGAPTGGRNTASFSNAPITAGAGTCGGVGNATNFQGITATLSFTNVTGSGVTYRGAETGTSGGVNRNPASLGGSPTGRRFIVKRNAATAGTSVVVEINFSVPVRDLDFTLLDVDRSNNLAGQSFCSVSENYTDEVTIAALSSTPGGTPVTPSTIQLGVPIGGGSVSGPTVAGTYPTFAGTACSGDGTTTSNIRLYFQNQSVQRVSITYTSPVPPTPASAITEQYIGISNMTWC